jgi:hypothetical protein
MKMGTKTLLFGCHQFIIHPFFTGLAWVKLYRKLPNWKEAVCILIHDWGYWDKPNVDGPEGERHPEWAAHWAFRYLDRVITDDSDHPVYIEQYHANLCLYHSSTLAKRDGVGVSKLCLPDKYGITMVPIWLMVLLGKLTGETKEYKYAPNYAQAMRQGMSDRQMYQSFRDHYRARVIPGFRGEQVE